MNILSSPTDLSRSLVATVTIFAFGSALHFVYGWLGEWRPAALFAAVNESVWEHLKIAFWPGLFWAATQRRSSGASPEVFWAAQGAGLLVTSLVIIFVFYGYTSVLGDNLLLVDISTFAMAIFFGQVISVAARQQIERVPWSRVLGLGLLFSQIFAFATLTYLPPPLQLFVDPRSGLSGIEAFRGAPDH